ncbi:MBL fold metallo-hydrolase [Patescibacteria group bacterium]|nr:MBL fold metallo-hydrolase [Patescibacteria group bacterium]
MTGILVPVMDITWHGHACFSLKGKSATIAIDPFSKIGLKDPKLEANILLISHDHFDHSNAGAVSGDPYVVDVPGEYESQGVMIEGIPTFHDDKDGAERGPNTVFSFRLDGIHFVHLGDLGHKLSEEVIERIGDVDVLFIPVGGHFTIDAKGAAEVVKQLQPRETVPMHYQVPGLNLKELASVDKFLKEVGAKVKKLDKKTWKLKPADLPEEDSEVVVFPNP